MAELKRRKLIEALNDLDRCLSAYEPSKKSERSIYFIALTKAFEVALVYAWKDLKKSIEDGGLEAYYTSFIIQQ